MSVITDEIEHFKHCCENHGMSINFSKSKLLSINFSHLPLTPILTLEAVPALKFLGLVFNSFAAMVGQRPTPLNASSRDGENLKLNLKFLILRQILSSYANPLMLILQIL